MKAQPSQKLLEELGSEILPPEYGGSGMSVKVDIVQGYQQLLMYFICV